MMNYEVQTLPHVLKTTVQEHSARPAVAFVGDKPVTYAEFGKKVQQIMAMLEKLEIIPGDRVAILGANMPHWGAVYFAIVSMGAIVVPLLPDFSPEEIKNTLRHSRTVAMFITSSLLPKMEKLSVHSLKYRILLDDLSLLGKEILAEANSIPEKEYDVHEDDVAAIIYTSGTTGRSKGVMLTHKNIVFNAVKASNFHKVTDKSRFLSILPLSHTYENTVGLIVPLMHGSCIYYLKKAPTPAILIPAFQIVKPTIMLSVPLIIEKIYRSKVLPAFTEKKWMKKLYTKPFFRKILNRMAGKKLLKIFGGEMEFFGIGGAKINEQVEQFLLEAHFPYAVGYGLTETAPLLAGFGIKEARLQAAGKIIDGVEVVIHDPDDETGEGEIWARGDNVMKGYYKEPELTKQVLTEDGWFRTGDLGIFDKDGYLYIKGRSKNVIIGPGGENIYPEEIESVINNIKDVVESLVVEQGGKLVALVHMDWEAMKEKYSDLKEGINDFIEKHSKTLTKEIQEQVNQQVSRFARVQQVRLHQEEFIKTATKKIKRFLYKEESHG